MRTFRHLIVVIGAVFAVTGLNAGTPSSAAAQSAPVASSDTVTFNIAVRGVRVGQEMVKVAATSDGWLIASYGSQAAPSNFTINKFEVSYSKTWQPRSVVIEAQTTQLMTLTSTFANGSVTNDMMQGGQKILSSSPVSDAAVVLPNNLYAAYEAMAARLSASAIVPGAIIPVYVAPQSEVSATVVSITAQRLQTPSSVVELRHFALAIRNPNGVVDVTVSVDSKGRLARVAIPAVGLVVLRDDLSNVMTRDATYQNDSDKQVFIQALGFTIAATTTSPAASAEKFPAVVLVGSTGQGDRDEGANGVPVFGHLSGELAKAGYFVVRYDKRGVGQSGGRPESATLHDYADDTLSVVEWLRKRKDIDTKRIALIGYAEGGAIAMLAADRAGDKVAALALIAAPGMTGRDVVLAQQAHNMTLASNPDDEKRAMTEMQRRILDAVASGRGWDGIPATARRAADTPLFKSYIEFDPAVAMKNVDQPVMVIQGDRDTQVAPVNADRLEALSTGRKAKAAALTKKVLIPGVNHLLVPAATGEMMEYPSLAGKSLSPVVSASLADWLRAVMTKK